MSPGRTASTLTVALLLAAALQASVSAHLAVLGAPPDFPIVVLCVSSLSLTRVGGATCGLASAIVYCAVSLANLAHYSISRCVTGFAIAWSGDSGFRPGPIVAMAVTFAGSLAAQFLLVFMPPPREMPPPLTDTILSAIYNGVLAMPAYALLTKAMGSKPT